MTLCLFIRDCFWIMIVLWLILFIKILFCKMKNNWKNLRNRNWHRWKVRMLISLIRMLVKWICIWLNWVIIGSKWRILNIHLIVWLIRMYLDLVRKVRNSLVRIILNSKGFWIFRRILKYRWNRRKWFRYRKKK